MKNTTFGTVFIGGSKSVGALPAKAADWLDYFIEAGEQLIVSDCHGADLAMQNYLRSRKYQSVTIYYSGDRCQFNVGDWRTERLCDENDDSKLYDEMVALSNCAFLIWDGKSQETANVIKTLRQHGLPIFIYRTDRDALSVIRRNSSLNNK